MKEIKPQVKESAIVSACLKTLFTLGCYAWRNNSGAYKPEQTGRFIRFGLKGSADIIGIMPNGKFLAVECKSAKGQQTLYQQIFQKRIEEKGGIYLLVHSVDELLEQWEKLHAGS